MALKWAVCEHFRDYLFQVQHFATYTDYSPLTYIKNTSKFNPTGQRWINKLVVYSFTTYYKPGVENVVPVTLSRLTIRDTKCLEAYLQLFCVDEVKATFDEVINQSCNGKTWLPKVNIAHANMENQENEILYEEGKGKESLAVVDFSKAQMEDETITKVIQAKREGIALTTSDKSKESKEVWMF